MKRKIIMVGAFPPPHHGSNIYFHNLFNSSLATDYDLHHLDTSDHRNLDNIAKLDITNVYLALRNIIELVIKASRIGPDIIYISPAANLLAYLRDGLFMLCGHYFSPRAKIVIHLHGGTYFRKEFYDKANYFTRWFIRFTLSKVNTAIVLGDCLKNIFDDLVENVVSVPNGTELIIDESLLKKHPYCKNEKIVVNYLGNLFESKGVFDVIQAAKRIIECYPGAVFNFAGSWFGQEKDFRSRIETFLAENKMSGSVHFIGKITGADKVRFLVEADIFLFPTWYPFEGFPLVILEAMAAGVPVVSTKGVGAIEEVVLHEKTGLLIEPHNTEQIVDALTRLISDPALREKMGVEGRKRYLENYTIQINIEKIKSVFEGVIASELEGVRR